MTGVVVVNGAGALNTVIDALSAVGARYFGVRRAAFGVVLLQCMTQVTDDVPFAGGVDAGVPWTPGLREPPPPPPHAASSRMAPAAPIRRTTEWVHGNVDGIRIAASIIACSQMAGRGGVRSVLKERVLAWCCYIACIGLASVPSDQRATGTIKMVSGSGMSRYSSL